MVNKFLLLVKTSRPIFWIIMPIIFSVGLFYSGAQFSTLAIIQLIFLSFPYGIFLYGINDVYDYESDKLNPRKDTKWGIKLKLKHHHFIKKVSLAIVILFALISLATLNWTNIIAVGLLLFFSYFYSVPPLRIKELPPLDSISNGILYIFAPALLGFSYGGNLLEFPIKAYFVIFCGIGLHALTTIPDYTVDNKVKDKTFAVAYGKRAAAAFALAMFLITVFFAQIQTFMINYYLIFCTLAALTILIYPSEKFSLILVKLIFIGFIGMSILFLVLNYLL